MLPVKYRNIEEGLTRVKKHFFIATGDELVIPRSRFVISTYYPRIQ